MKFFKMMFYTMVLGVCFILNLINNLMFLVARFARLGAFIILISGFSLFMVSVESGIGGNLSSPLFIVIILSLATILALMKPFVEKSQEHLVRVTQRVKNELRSLR